ncbi:acyl-CoA carboxylase subunit beta [Gleimia sp. 6138-11-ORH1]|uniref:acyl-CoA carboxylase subunit beta n=1 Tax=Gleimia sp. 6138-11-ORH1 TaxID=2973937 RepID=UPI0021698E82|nr:acyl-CoA carboxylase subunit beta [Gleimia sp. 6138-11-ORH1]MCS4484609.1 acyl-CoA carboxylase subunit beta [Gleimia sp. 6138-11-ORH1]
MSRSILSIARESLAKAFHFPAHSQVAEPEVSASHSLDELEDIAEQRARAMQHPKGKQTARERINALADAGTFAEINRFLGGDIDAGYLGSGVITGFAKISGRSVAIYAQDFSIRGGSLGEVEGRKILHLMEQALIMRIPVIAMLDSGGARIQEGVAALAQYGRIFKKSCELSGVVPQISIILGPCAGGAVYGPALTDFVIMAKESSFMFVTGPEVVKAVTGESVSSEELGGAKLHSAITGVAHYMAEDETDALDYTRSLLSYLPSSFEEPAPCFAYAPTAEDEERAKLVASLVPKSPKQPYDMVEVIEHLVDHGEFLQIQELFAPSIVIGFGAFNGRSVGVVANQSMADAGTLDVNASEKASRFVQFCNAFSIPVITLVDVPGYRPGTEQERAGIIRRGAKMITAYSTATIPLVTIILRKAYGGAYIVMGSKAMGADLNFAWPDAQIAVMGAEGAVNIVHRKDLQTAKEQGQNVDELRIELEERYAFQSVNPNLSLKIGELDGLIRPEDTRSVIISSLTVLAGKRRPFREPRITANPPL